MTKKVRIENADTSDHKLLIQVWDKGFPEGNPDKLVKELQADYPTTLIEELVWDTRYLVIKEYK